MTPIVFWASFVPCAKAMKLPDPTCARRNARLSGPCRTRRKSHRIATMIAPAMRNPMTGLARPGHTTLFQMPSHWTGSGPPAASAAPTRPPTSACDDEDGRPRYHVKRFQTIAPISAAIIRWPVTRPGLVLMRPSPTVFATAVDVKAPRKFMIAAMNTAIRGERARVETDVATAFAVSWKPFVKSNASATRTITTRRPSLIGSSGRCSPAREPRARSCRPPARGRGGCPSTG